MMSIKELGEQLSKVKEYFFAERDQPEIGPALDAQPPEDEDKEIWEAKQKNKQYGKDPKEISLYSRLFPKLDAVFEENGDEADSWQAKSAQANGSAFIDSIDEKDFFQVEEANQLIREPARNVSDINKDDCNQIRHKSAQVGSKVMGPKSGRKFASVQDSLLQGSAKPITNSKKEAIENEMQKPDDTNQCRTALNVEEEKKATQPQVHRNAADHSAGIQV